MKINGKTRWIFAIAVFVVAAGMVRMSLNNEVYLPIVDAMASLTPTKTPTPTATQTATPTRTPTPSPTPNYVVIMEIVQSDTSDPLNEYVSIKNYSSKAVGLTDWFIRDDGPNRYNFPDGFVIASKQTIKLWTKAGTNTASNLFWGSPVEVWNNGYDCAYLRDDSQGDNELIDVYCYQQTQDGTIVIIRNPTE